MLTLQTAWAESFDHDSWNALLNKYVHEINDGKASVVDYQGLADHRQLLTQYLQSQSAVTQARFDQWPSNEQLAFLINAYNAWTVELVLTAWPDLSSIKDLGGLLTSPWSKRFIPLFGKQLSLDDIEHQLIRGSGRYNDPRIHFAVNCASVGCPALRSEAYRGEKLDAQLDEQTGNFLRDKSRNRVQDDELQLSAIFKWYREDFEKGWSGYNSLEDFLVDHAQALELTSAMARELELGDMEIVFLDYDWRLNYADTLAPTSSEP